MLAFQYVGLRRHGEIASLAFSGGISFLLPLIGLFSARGDTLGLHNVVFIKLNFEERLFKELQNKGGWSLTKAISLKTMT